MVLQLDEDVVISLSYVELCEDQQSSEFVNEVRNEGEMVGVLDHMAIEIPVVLAGV